MQSMLLCRSNEVTTARASFICLDIILCKNAILLTGAVVRRQINVPGFSGDTIRVYKRPKPSVIHQERLLAVQRQAAGTEACTKIPDTDDATGTAQKSKAKGPKGGASISPAMKGT